MSERDKNTNSYKVIGDTGGQTTALKISNTQPLNYQQKSELHPECKWRFTAFKLILEDLSFEKEELLPKYDREHGTKSFNYLNQSSVPTVDGPPTYTPVPTDNDNSLKQSQDKITLSPPADTTKRNSSQKTKTSLKGVRASVTNESNKSRRSRVSVPPG